MTNKKNEPIPGINHSGVYISVVIPPGVIGDDGYQMQTNAEWPDSEFLQSFETVKVMKAALMELVDEMDKRRLGWLEEQSEGDVPES